MDVSELDGCGEVIELDGCTRDVFKKMRLDECMDFTEKGGKESYEKSLTRLLLLAEGLQILQSLMSRHRSQLRCSSMS